MTLPGNPPATLSKAVSGLSTPRQVAFLRHLLGGTSADFLADWLTRAGQPVGATTIKTYRARLKMEEAR